MRAARKIIFVLIFSVLLVQVGFSGIEKGMKVIGQEGVSIQMTVDVGFDGFIRDNMPVPVRIEIFNGSETFLDGEISIDTKNWIPPASYTHAVHVPPGQTVVFNMYIYEGVTTSVDVVLNNTNGREILKKSVSVYPIDRMRGILILNLSTGPNKFDFLDAITIPGLRQFNNAPVYMQPGMPSSYNLSQITIGSEYPPHLSSNVTAWDSLSSVFCDLRSYVRLESELKKRLVAWVDLGGELLLFPPAEKLTSDEITQLNEDSFLPFKIAGYEKPPGGLKYDLISILKLDDILNVEYNSEMQSYSFGEGTSKLISTSVAQCGGVTLFKFHPDAINLEKLDVWIEIMFQLGLLTPYPHRHIVQGTYTRLVSQRSSRGSHIPTREERFIKGITVAGTRLFLTVLLPTLIILLIGVLFYRSGRKMFFLYYILPILIIICVFIPSVAVKKVKIDIRQFEGYHVLQLTKSGLPSVLNSYLVIGKKYPQSGTLTLNNQQDFSFYDEIINAGNGVHPVINVDCTPPGSVETLELSPEEYRVMLVMSEKTQTAGIDGKIKFNPDGSFEYEIRNNTEFSLSNCEFYPYGLHLMPTQLPRMLPDMEPGQVVTGRVIDRKDNESIDNADVIEFAYEMGPGIFSPDTRKELMYSFEAQTQGTAYKVHRPWYAYSDEALFFAFTKDFKSGIEVNQESVTGPEMTLITTRLKIEMPEDFEKNRIADIAMLFSDASNSFEKYRIDEMFPRG